MASNYNPNANQDDYSCIILGCTDINALNYNPNVNTDDGSCFFFQSGCTDSSAVNFDPLANVNTNLPPVKEPMSKTTKGILIGVGVLAVGVAVWYFAIRKK